MKRIYFTVFLALGALACGTGAEDPIEMAEAARPHHIDVATDVTCDAGDESFVKRVIPFLWGRRPESIREVQLLMEVIEQSDRATLVRAMTATEEFNVRGWSMLKDILDIPRAGFRSNALCYGEPLGETTGTELAVHVRDNDPLAAEFPADWNLTDLFRSSVALGDISPLMRAHLLQIPANPIIPQWNQDFEKEMRELWAFTFLRTYMNREASCLVCHNSVSNVLFDSDPLFSRAWALPGSFEEPLFGHPSGPGVGSTTINALFRQSGVVAAKTIPGEIEGGVDWVHAEGVSPWGLVTECGAFIEPALVEPDELGQSAYFINDYGLTGSVFDIERHLRAGYASLRGKPYTPSADGSVTGDDALAYLGVASFVDAVWKEAMGAPLTIANHIPRNKYQLELLMELSDAFLVSGYSYTELLVRVLTHPYYNQKRPEECEVPGAPYYLPPIFEPWSVDAEQEAARPNGFGELLHRHDARLLYNSIAHAMRWPYPPEFIMEVDTEARTTQLPDEGRFQRDIGIYLKDTERGFRGTNLLSMLAWEDGFGACVDQGDHSVKRTTPPAPDFINDLLDAAPADATLGDVMSALQDRLLTDPDVTHPAVRLGMEIVLGAPLDTPLAGYGSAELAVRLVCGTILSSPQFVFDGDYGPDRAGITTRIIPTGTSSEELCEKLAGALALPGGATCSGGHITVK